MARTVLSIDYGTWTLSLLTTSPFRVRELPKCQCDKQSLRILLAAVVQVTPIGDAVDEIGVEVDVCRQNTASCPAIRRDCVRRRIDASVLSNSNNRLPPLQPLRGSQPIAQLSPFICFHSSSSPCSAAFAQGSK